MNIIFHPMRVRSREHIAAADRHQAVKNLARERESLLLSEDGNPEIDFHDGSAEVGGRVGPHIGYAKRDGGLDIQTLIDDQTEHLQRNDDGSSLSLSKTDGKQTTTETFVTQSDGSVSYTKAVMDVAPQAPGFEPISYQLGGVSSPCEVEAHEAYSQMNEGFEKLEALVDEHDGSQEFDFNETPGILAGDSVPVSVDFAFRDTVKSPEDDRYRRMLKTRAQGAFYEPTMSGYVEPGGEVIARTKWNLHPAKDEGIETSYVRSADGSKAVVSSEIQGFFGRGTERAEYTRTDSGRVTLNRSRQAGES